MVQIPIKPELNTLYPDSDGKPMADNTKQYQWITRLVTNLRHLLKGQTAFVAGDLLWYPVQVGKGETAPRQAPDAMVVLGRPDGDRGSYQQWKEDGIAPQVVFEIISPGNTMSEMLTKQVFYIQHGVLEAYFYDPDTQEFWGLARENAADAPNTITLDHLPWTSPLLGIRFEMLEDGLAVFYPDGEPFKTPEELAQERDQLQGERDELQVKYEQSQAEQDRLRAQMEQMAAQLRAAGLEPDGP
ncbi:MAG: Uma2 family endonuclease [Spirulinaceae cyanobacterium]